MFLRECSTPCPDITENDTVVKYIDRVDTIILNKTTYIPKIVYQKVDSIVWVHYQVDTLQILEDYFLVNYYQDTIMNDTNGLIYISDSVTRNRIVSRFPSIKLYPHFITETITTKEPLKNKVFIGLGVGRSAAEFGVSGNIGLMTKKDNLYTVSYDMINKDIYLSLYWKLKLKK